MHDKYLVLSAEEFAILNKRNLSFQDSCSDPDKEPVKVFSPLTEKRLAEVYLIREVSKDLAIKKEEDMKKAAQKAEEMKETTQEKPEEKTEDSAEEKKPETEK